GTHPPARATGTPDGAQREPPHCDTILGGAQPEAAMFDTLRTVFSTSDFMPHGHCFLWKAPLVALHVTSDALIGTAYLIISLTLWHLVRRIRLPFSPMILAFGMFIGACGLTHYLEILTLWDPQYWLSGFVKAVTAAASVATGAYLVRLRPAIVGVTQSAQLSEERRVKLEVKNRELEALYAQVKELDDAKTRLFANASHELRTPLALVLGPVEKLLDDGLPPAARRDLEVVRRNARLLLRHVDELLEVARLEEGAVRLQPGPVDLAAMLRAVFAQFEVLARERAIQVQLDAPDAVAARADAAKLERVLANVVGNAFKFVPDAGHVRAALTVADGRATVRVEDDGPGIAPDMREAVFERFRQDPGRVGRYGGAGLGLAIARDFAALHGGTIHVRETPHGGAALELEIPLEPPPGGSAPSAPARSNGHDGLASGAAAGLAEELRTRTEGPSTPVGPAGAPSVLVVEDNGDALSFVAEALGAEFRVGTATGGREALQMAEALLPDAIVTDLMMPEGSGDALITQLRSRPALAGTPTIVLTARADPATRVRLLREGADDYVVKPFLPEELRARVRNLVSMKRSRDVLARELRGRTGDLEALASALARRSRELEVALETTRVAREAAERASAVKSRFLRLISHELRTPLTPIRLGIAVLAGESETPLTPRQSAIVERISRAASRLGSLLESLLEYTRVESGRLLPRNEAVDVAALAAAVVDDVLPQAQQKLISLTLEPSPSLAPLTTDPRLLHLVLLNLVVNAVKYTARGSVRVVLGGGPVTRWIEVRDTGPGIPEQDRERLFEPFEQLGSPGTVGGVGLGLALVKRIVASLGGTVELQSAVGRGSVFRVELPVLPAVSAPPTVEA
ncbi:MAG: ATP-binding protein, partial [Solirubrobacterales bacterium]